MFKFHKVSEEDKFNSTGVSRRRDATNLTGTVRVAVVTTSDYPDAIKFVARQATNAEI